MVMTLSGLALVGTHVATRPRSPPHCPLLGAPLAASRSALPATWHKASAARALVSRQGTKEIVVVRGHGPVAERIT